MSKERDYRMEKDVFGEAKVPADVYWGINTFRAVQNFRISDKRFPDIFITSLAEIKKACLLANMVLGSVDLEKGNALLQALKEMLDENKFYDQFPIDVYQTGSITQTHMNMNEVLANRANEILGFPMGKKSPVHPNDHANSGQSTNDVIPTAMHLSVLYLTVKKLVPSLDELVKALEKKIMEFKGIVKVGRTHLQDAVPIPLSMEFEVYKQQIETNISRLNEVCEELTFIPLGGSAIGTGINTPEGFVHLALRKLQDITGFPFKPNPVRSEGMSSHNTLAAASAVMRQLALSLMKMANDIRWMASGPRAGLFELLLPENEPGSSIMPGKVNPTQAEALIQVCIQTIGNDAAIVMAESYGSVLDLNACKPVIIYNLLDSIDLISNAVRSFIEHCLKGIKANKAHIDTLLERMLMTVTNLSPYIGYDKCAEIAQRAFRENKTIREVIKDLKIKIEGDLDELLDPAKMV